MQRLKCGVVWGALAGIGARWRGVACSVVRGTVWLGGLVLRGGGLGIEKPRGAGWGGGALGCGVAD